mgnify:CR=1 FL=1
MNALQIGIMIFTILEIGNVCILYFMPETTMANGIGVFNAWEKSKGDPQVHSLMKYLVNWVAGAKLIFVLMGIVVIIFGNELTQIFTVVALIISILSFYYRLFPSIKKMDSLGEITPKGYSKTLNFMIASFIIGFIAVLVIYLLT